MDKELALIFEYKDAPQTLKDVALAHRSNSSKLAQQKAKLLTLQKEVTELERAYAESAKAFTAELNAWTPKGV